MNAPVHHGFTGRLAEIAEAAGPAAALQLVRELGGREIKLSARPGGKLAGIVGAEAAAKIVAALGNEKITVPMANLRGQRGRREAAARMLDAGASVSQVAGAVDVHERTVFRVKAETRTAGPLFDDECPGSKGRA